MAAKPTQDPKWVASDDPNEIIEPTPALKNNGILSGGVWGREHLNWMFNAFSKWIDWVRSYAMDKSLNLSELEDKAASRVNLGVLEAGESGAQARTNTQNDSRFVQKTQTATTTIAGVVEKATSTEMVNGAASKYPDAETIKGYYGEARVQTFSGIAGTTGGSLTVTKQGRLVNISGNLQHSNSTALSLSGVLPSWARPVQAQSNNTYFSDGEVFPTRISLSMIRVYSDGSLVFSYPLADTAGNDSGDIYRSQTFTGFFNITYAV